MSRHDSGCLVVVWCRDQIFLGRDKGVSVGGAEAGRDIVLRSRPGLLKLGVTTWALGRDEGRCSSARDQARMRARPA